MGLGGNVLLPEPVKISFIELMEIQALCGAHFAAPYYSALFARPSLSGNGCPVQAMGFSAHCPPGTSYQ
jgi:hypothetical protein